MKLAVEVKNRWGYKEAQFNRKQNWMKKICVGKVMEEKMTMKDL